MTEERFAEPDEQERAAISYQPPVEVEAAAVAVGGDRVVQVYELLARRLEQRVAAEGTDVVALELGDLQGSGNVVGVGIGSPEGEAALATPVESAALNLYLIEPMAAEQLREIVAEELGQGAAEVPINPIVTGEISALSHTLHLRPAPGGISIGHLAITAGTLGCLARGLNPPRDRRLLVLSNNHVLAAANAGSFGDVIVQPGPTDGGTDPPHGLARLERFVPLDFSGAANFVDCATAWARPDQVRRELMHLSGGSPVFFRLGPGTRECEKDLRVGKTGRTTQLTAGTIIDCVATVRVRYGGRTALFRDQIAIQGPPGTLFSRGGDSGSIIWTDDERVPVGLLFAGGGLTTFANKIHHVLTALDIDLVR